MLTDAVRHPQGLALTNRKPVHPFGWGGCPAGAPSPCQTGLALGGVQGRRSQPWQGPASMEAERSEVSMTMGSLVSY